MPLIRRGSSIRFIARPTYGVLVSATGHLPGGAGLHDRVDDVRVAGAAAQVAAQAFRDLRARRRRILREQVNRRHDHPRRAVAALQAMAVPEALLHGVEMAVADALDRRHARAVGLDGEHRARFHRLTVHEHGAGAADARLASDVRAREAAEIPEIVDEQHARLDDVFTIGVVDAQTNWDGHEHLLGWRGPPMVLETAAKCQDAAAVRVTVLARGRLVMRHGRSKESANGPTWRLPRAASALRQHAVSTGERTSPEEPTWQRAR